MQISGDEDEEEEEREMEKSHDQCTRHSQLPSNIFGAFDYVDTHTHSHTHSHTQIHTHTQSCRRKIQFFLIQLSF